MVHSKTIEHPTTDKTLEAAFAYEGYTYYTDQEDYNDSTNTLAYENKTESNDMLTLAVDRYCHNGGEVWMSEYFQGSVVLYKEENHI